MLTVTQTNEILDFWFSNQDKWWSKDECFDNLILNKYNDLHEAISKIDIIYELDINMILAMVIVLDQFSRNMYRNTPKMYSSDEVALKLTHHAYSNQLHAKLNPDQQVMLFMPLMHSEKLSDQNLLISIYKNLNIGNEKYALAHQKIIERFGRFPHRNEILGRNSTESEIEFLKEPGSSF